MTIGSFSHCFLSNTSYNQHVRFRVVLCLNWFVIPGLDIWSSNSGHNLVCWFWYLKFLLRESPLYRLSFDLYIFHGIGMIHYQWQVVQKWLLQHRKVCKARSKVSTILFFLFWLIFKHFYVRLPDRLSNNSTCCLNIRNASRQLFVVHSSIDEN